MRSIAAMKDAVIVTAMSAIVITVIAITVISAVTIATTDGNLITGMRFLL